MIFHLYVFYNDDPVGQITLDEKRRWILQYDSRWMNNANAFPISVQLPMQAAAFDPDHAKPFFANLLPEGDVRNLIAKKLQISEGNDFELLKRLGGECAGALSVQLSNEISSSPQNYRELSQLELRHAIDDMGRRPLLAIDGNARLSLSGAQEKLPTYIASGQIYIPEGGSPSTHILKPAMQHFENSVQNELFCLQLAHQLGLSVPAASMIDDGAHKILMVARYDRKITESDKVVRLHQEDFCQALGKMPDQKYQSEGGPSFADCFGVLDQYGSDPAADKKRLIEWAAFNWVIGNCDAHAKNISLLITASGIHLAPFYDLMSTVIYEGLSEKMAMKIGGHYERDVILERHWEKFAVDIGVKSVVVIQAVKAISKKLAASTQAEAAKFIAEHGGEKTISKIVSIIEKSAKRVL